MEKTSELMALELAGILIAPSCPLHSSKKVQKKWFRKWEKLLTKSIQKNILVLKESSFN